MLPAIADHYPKPRDINGRAHGYVDNSEMMDFYKNQLNRVNGAMQMLPSNDYGGGGPLMPSGAGVLGAGGLLGRMQAPPPHNRNYSYG